MPPRFYLSPGIFRCRIQQLLRLYCRVDRSRFCRARKAYRERNAMKQKCYLQLNSCREGDDVSSLVCCEVILTYVRFAKLRSFQLKLLCCWSPLLLRCSRVEFSSSIRENGFCWCPAPFYLGSIELIEMGIKCFCTRLRKIEILTDQHYFR